MLSILYRTLFSCLAVYSQDAPMMLTEKICYFGRLSGKRGFLEVKELAVQAFILTPLPPGTDAHLQAGLN